MPIEKKPLSWFKPAPFNPRKKLKPGDPEFEALRKSIIEFDHVQLIVANKNGMVLGGHQTLEVLKSLGRDGANAYIVDLSEAKQKALCIALNKIHGAWDMPLLKDLLGSLDDGGFDMGSTGFLDDELKDLMNFDGGKPEDRSLTPYKRVHVLLSFPPDRLAEVAPLLEEIKGVEGVEHEQSAN